MKPDPGNPMILPTEYLVVKVADWERWQEAAKRYRALADTLAGEVAFHLDGCLGPAPLWIQERLRAIDAFAAGEVS